MAVHRPLLPWRMPGGHSKGLARRILLYGRRVRQAKLAGGLAGFFEQLDISHGGPRDERSPGVVFFGAFFFDCFYGDSTGVVVDQPSVEAAPAPEPHGYSLSIPLLRQIPGQHASPVRLRSPGILPFGPAPALVLVPSSTVKRVTSYLSPAFGALPAPLAHPGRGVVSNPPVPPQLRPSLRRLASVPRAPR